MTSSSQISRRFVKPVGFSNGWAELALKKPPPFVPSSLIASWLATGPPGSSASRPGRVVASREAVEVLDDALARRARARRRTPAAAGCARRPRTGRPRSCRSCRSGARARPRIERDRDGDADGGRDEVLHREPGHLGEVAHRRLAGVVLPVRVGDEADRGVERERRRDGCDVGRVERQRALDALEHVEAEHRDDAEREQRERVDVHRCSRSGVDAASAVDDALDREEHAVRPAPAPPARTRARYGTEQPRGDEDGDRRARAAGASSPSSPWPVLQQQRRTVRPSASPTRKTRTSRLRGSGHPSFSGARIA